MKIATLYWTFFNIWIKLFEWRFEIHVSNSPKRFQPNTEHFQI